MSMRPVKIQDISAPELEAYRSLKGTPKFHSESGIFIAEGKKVVLKLLNSRLQTISILAVEEFYKEYQELIENSGVKPEFLFTADKPEIEKIVGFKLHTGIMAIGKQPGQATLREMNSPICILSGVVDSENVGAIARNCAAFGCDSLIIDPASSSPFLRRAIRVSMGAIFDMKYLRTSDLSKTILELKNREFEVIAAEICKGSKSILTHEFRERRAIIFGSESLGISPEILKIADNVLHIPITDKIPSINVAATSGIFLFFLRNKS